ncbi:MAG: hypothetical protein WCK02_17925 [Bacteroidota bacterium]
MKTKKLLLAALFSALFLNLANASSFPNRISSLQNNTNAFFQSLNYLETSLKNDAPELEDWSLCYESDKIYIYERWVKNSIGNLIRERKGVMIVNSNVSNAVYHISNYDFQKKWMKNVESTRLLKKKSDTCWITYTIFGLPWPLDNRDVVSEYHLKTAKSGNFAKININSLNNLVKESDGISRIKNYNATWEIKKLNETKIAITFTASSDAQQIAPAVILDPIMRKTFQKNLLNLRNMLEVKILVKI